MNYYDVLDLHPQATYEEIRSSFRKKVMQHHPDRNPDDRERAEERVRAIIEAYRVLCDPDRRCDHDARLNNGNGSLRTQTIWDEIRTNGDPASKSRLVLHELLEGNGARAVEIFESLLRNYINYDLLLYLDLKDYLDCKFMLAEEYERSGNLKLALEMYKEIYREEEEPPRICFFFDELKLRLRDLYCRKLTRKTKPRIALDYYAEALAFIHDKADRSLVFKRMAECYLKLQDTEEARASLEEAFRLNPRMKGARRICEKLCITQI